MTRQHACLVDLVCSLEVKDPVPSSPSLEATMSCGLTRNFQSCTDFALLITPETPPKHLRSSVPHPGYMRPEQSCAWSGAKDKLGLRVHGLIVGSPEKKRADPAVLRSLCSHTLPSGKNEVSR